MFAHVRIENFLENILIFIITFAAIVSGIRTYDGIDDSIKYYLYLFDRGITLLFLIELTLRFCRSTNPRTFFLNPWNIFDIIIIFASLALIDGVIAGRVIRIFRVFRLVSLLPELRILVSAFFRAIPNMGYVSLFMFIVFYSYGVFGSVLFRHINSELWGNVGLAMLTLFQISTFEGWADIMHETMIVYPLSWIYYVSFIFIVSFAFLNMMIGVLVEAIQEARTRHNNQKKSNIEEESFRYILHKLESIERKLESGNDVRSQ